MSKKRPYNQRFHERKQSTEVHSRPPQGLPPILIGLGIAALVGLIGWFILQGVTSKQSPTETSIPPDSSLQVVPSSEDNSPDTQAGAAIQNAPTESLDGSPSSALQPTGNSVSGPQTDSELFQQVENGNLQINP